MNESTKNINYVNHSRFHGIAAPVLSLALSLLFWHTFVLDGYGPGVGVPVFVGCHFGAVMLMLGRRARYTKESVFLLIVSMGLAVSCWLYSTTDLMMLNCFIILATAAGATFLLSGQNPLALGDARFLPETIRLSVLALFTRIHALFRPMTQLGQGRKSTLGQVGLSLLVCIPLLAIVLALLASADAVFDSFFDAMRAWLEELSLGEVVWKLCRTIVLALMIGSGLHYLIAVPARETEMPKARERQALPFLLPVLLLDGVYILFCAVQIKYLFGGAESTAISGHWAYYARQGFFQLVAVAAINLTLCTLGAHRDRVRMQGGTFLRIALGLMLILTLVILASAARRMQLYILAYGLSTLRLMTLWGMAVILAGIGLAGWKLIDPNATFLRVFIPLVLGSWCLFCLAGPGPLQAHYNVNRYLQGSLTEVDTIHLSSLGTDALPALYRLEEAEPDLSAAAISRIRNFAEDRYGDRPWSTIKLSYRHLEH